MFDIFLYIPTRHKKSSSGWISFNCPACHHYGQPKPDSRQRGGLLIDTDGSWYYHCFNCHFKARFKWGERLTFKAKQLLIWLGVGIHTLNLFQLDTIKRSTLEERLFETHSKHEYKEFHFDEIVLPEKFELLDKDNENHTQYIEYLNSRNLDPFEYPYLVTHEKRKGITIPFTHNNKLVGYTTRFLDNRRPKYVSHCPHGYAFGCDFQQPHWTKILVVEGIFDALSINGISTMTNNVSDMQTEMINNFHRDVIVVPDYDKPGLDLINKAILNEWGVSFPEWPDDIKDVSESCQRFGHLETIIMIMNSVETNPLKIKLLRNKLAARLQ